MSLREVWKSLRGLLLLIAVALLITGSLLLHHNITGAVVMVCGVISLLIFFFLSQLVEVSKQQRGNTVYLSRTRNEEGESLRGEAQQSRDVISTPPLSLPVRDIKAGPTGTVEMDAPPTYESVMGMRVLPAAALGIENGSQNQVHLQEEAAGASLTDQVCPLEEVSAIQNSESQGLSGFSGPQLNVERLTPPPRYEEVLATEALLQVATHPHLSTSSLSEISDELLSYITFTQKR